LGGSDVWLAKPIADLASPICRCEDEPHPSHAIVRACSRVASRNGAAGYKVMRFSHEPMDVALDLLNAPLHRTRSHGNRELPSDARGIAAPLPNPLRRSSSRP
jgi:hypothetical protein